MRKLFFKVSIKFKLIRFFSLSLGFKLVDSEFFVIESDDVQATILDFIMYKELDVLTLLPYKRGFFEGLFNPSLTKKLATDFEIPILSIPIK